MIGDIKMRKLEWIVSNGRLFDFANGRLFAFANGRPVAIIWEDHAVWHCHLDGIPQQFDLNLQPYASTELAKDEIVRLLTMQLNNSILGLWDIPPLYENAKELQDIVDEMENITDDQRMVLARSYGNEIVDDLPEYAIGIIEGTPADDTPVKDFEAVADWLDTWPKGTTFSYLGDSHFSGNPEFGLPCQCVTCIVHKGEEEPKKSEEQK